MTIERIHQDEKLRREEFPVCEQGVFLAHAAVCPLPKRAADAMIGYTRDCCYADQEEKFPLIAYGETRQLAAELLGCEAADIAIVGPTSVGLSLIANGVLFEAGDNVIFSPDDYPSNAVVWMNLEKKGVELRPLATAEVGKVTLEDVQALHDGKTRLVALASAHFVNGYRLDVDAIGSWLHANDTLFSVDGIQSIGAVRTPAESIDFIAADAHKWMLGPCAAGILYVSPQAREILEPTLVGWSNVICPDFLTPDEIAFKPDARKYEAGSQNLVGLMGLHASLKLIKEYGPSAIEETILGHTRFLRDALREKGYTLAGSDDDRVSGITSFRREGVDMQALHAKLTENKIAASLRKSRDGRSWLRFSPHFYNTKEDLLKALECV